MNSKWGVSVIAKKIKKREKLWYYFDESIASIGHTLNTIRVNVN